MLRVTGVSSGSSSARLLSVPCRALYQFPPLCSSVDGILLRVSGIFVADGSKNGLQGEDGAPALLLDIVICQGILRMYEIIAAS